MIAVLVAWGVSAALLLLLAGFLGTRVLSRPGPLGIIVDNRGRCSLNKLQLVAWSIVVLSLVSGVFFGRWLKGASDPLDFTIPGDVLGLLGISVGSGVTAGVVKATKNKTASTTLATQANTGKRPFFGQVFMLEEGEYADQIVDVTKFQNFAFTITLLMAYIATAINTIVDAKTADKVTALPGLGGTFLVLLGISYAGYVGGKLPSQVGSPAPPPDPGPPVAGLGDAAVPAAVPVAPPGGTPASPAGAAAEGPNAGTPVAPAGEEQ